MEYDSSSWCFYVFFLLIFFLNAWQQGFGLFSSLCICCSNMAAIPFSELLGNFAFFPLPMPTTCQPQSPAQDLVWQTVRPVKPMKIKSRCSLGNIRIFAGNHVLYIYIYIFTYIFIYLFMHVPIIMVMSNDVSYKFIIHLRCIP